MTNERFHQLTKEMVDDELDEHDRKSADYADPEITNDILYNFKEDSIECGITPEVDLLIHFKKHIRAIYKYCRTSKLASEDIRHRIRDARNYLVLLCGLIEDREFYIVDDNNK